MLAFRYPIEDTTRTRDVLAHLLRTDHLHRVIFFATEHSFPSDCEPRGLPSSNLPLVALLVKVELTPDFPISIVFDGNLLTAKRFPRYEEVRVVLDAAVECGRAFYCPTRVAFTSDLPPDRAMAILEAAGPVLQLTAESRPDYFSLLSTLPEAEVRGLIG